MEVCHFLLCKYAHLHSGFLSLNDLLIAPSLGNQEGARCHWKTSPLEAPRTLPQIREVLLAVAGVLLFCVLHAKSWTYSNEGSLLQVGCLAVAFYFYLCLHCSLPLATGRELNVDLLSGRSLGRWKSHWYKDTVMVFSNPRRASNNEYFECLFLKLTAQCISCMLLVIVFYFCWCAFAIFLLHFLFWLNV